MVSALTSALSAQLRKAGNAGLFDFSIRSLDISSFGTIGATRFDTQPALRRYGEVLDEF